MEDTIPRQLPTIIDWLKTLDGSTQWKIIKPLKGVELFPKDDETKILWVAELKMPEGCITPVHCHETREKMYVAFAGSYGFHLLELIDGKLKNTPLFNGGRAVVQPKTPHAVYAEGPNSSVLVVSSSKDASDTYWENKAEELAKRPA